MNDKVIYITTKENLTFEHLYTEGGYATYNVELKVDRFVGAYNFCISVEKIQQHIKEINNIILNLSGKLYLEDYDSDAYIEFTFEDKRIFKVNGQIGASYMGQMLKFEFEADHTILNRLKQNLLEY